MTNLGLITMKQPHLNSKSVVFTLVLTLFSIIMVSSLFAETSEDKRNQLEKKINSASSKLQSSRALSNSLRKKVRAIEAKLNALSKQIHQTEQNINKLTTRLIKSNALKKKLLAQIAAQKQALAQQMQALYTSGKQSHLRLLLKQDDPSDISRTIKYYEYMNRHRLKRIDYIKKRLEKVKRVEDQINTDSIELQKLMAQQKSKKIALKKAVKEKDRALRKQRKIVFSQEQKLARLKKEDARLKRVIQSLINKQKKEEQPTEKTVSKNEGDKKSKTKPKQVKRHYVPNQPFSSLKGKLSWPVNGRIKHKFGSARNSKIKWKGVIISAAGGTDVHAVARGKVEFSGRLKGYGYVIIIRHDKNYRSLYAYNRSIYKKAGDIVKTGEVIAAVGNSGRLEEPGLYFEISKGITRYNPARWCR